jgi:hypothetical protein
MLFVVKLMEEEEEIGGGGVTNEFTDGFYRGANFNDNFV